MIKLFQNLHAYFYGQNHQFDYKNTNRIKWLYANIFARVFERLIYWSILARAKVGCMPYPLNNDHKLVVSFTSFPARISTVWMVVDCLMRQTFKPRQINLYLSRVQFPNERAEIPHNLLKYEKLGLRIFFVDDDLKPHKKYYYASQTLRDECFVTFDDDLLYRDDVLERVWNLHLQYPDSVCANIGRKIGIKDERVMDYSRWNSLLDNMLHRGPDILAIGCGGILYPPSFYRKCQMLHNIEMIKKTSLKADDLWLKAMELLTNTQVVVKSYYATAASIPSTSNTALSVTNRMGGGTGNDDQWNALNKEFNLNEIIINNINN